ncbi:MAG: SRPBCC family protein [Chloroflexi bacterium]|nr:SRPBCC family protein [Chloroflexota bacterium]
MAIEIRETFVVEAPIDKVWRFVIDPQRVVGCMPGAELDEVVDDKTFLGTVSIKVGAVTARYAGRVQFTSVDERRHAVEMVAEGKETGGGTARATMSSSLQSLADGRTEVTTEASIDITGRIMQVGRGMIQGVSHQLFRQFVACAKTRLETADAEAETAVDAKPEPIRAIPLVANVTWTAIVNAVRRLLRRPST